MIVLTSLVWLSLGAILYHYAGYPLVMAVLAKLSPRRFRTSDPSGRTVSLLIAAYNEEAVIADKIDNSLKLDWNPGKLEIVVVSDGSQDRTNEIVSSFEDPRVRLIAIERNTGKMSALNTAAPRCRGHFICFSDANTMYDPQALKFLARKLTDSRVGAVCGQLRYHTDGKSEAGQGEGLYWRIESALKKAESRVHSLIGTNGSIYMIRRNEYTIRPTDLLDDLSIPCGILFNQNKPTVYEPRAFGYESPPESFEQEFRWKRRIITTAIYTMSRMWRDWIRRPFFAFEVISHKYLRWLAPVFMILLFVASTSHVLLTSAGSMTINLLLSGQIAFYSAALAGHFSESIRRYRPVSTIYFFCVINAASLFALINVLRGTTFVTWKTIRSGED